MSARNLYDFLNNKGKSNEVKIGDYKTPFKASSIARITGVLQDLNRQVFHFGKLRTKVQDQKVNLQKIEMLSCWVEENMQSLLNSFDNDTRKKN